MKIFQVYGRWLGQRLWKIFEDTLRKFVYGFAPGIPENLTYECSLDYRDLIEFLVD